MEYQRTPEEQIYADLADRLGKISTQYRELTKDIPEKERFEVSLDLALLQNIVANLNEHIRRLSKGNRRRTFSHLLNNDKYLGIFRNNVEKWTFAEEKTYGNVISKFRNALSHPLPITDLPHPPFSKISIYALA